MKDAMRARDKARLGAVRLILSEIKRVEVDERIDPDDVRICAILDKMAKQRRDSIAQFEQAGRTDLVDKEQFELDQILGYLPEPLSDEEVDARIKAAIATSGASGMKDMGRVMGLLQPDLKGRADMAEVSKRVKTLLG